MDCEYYYYFSDFGQYRCTIDGQCPLDSNLLIRPKNECVNNCKKDSFYIYLYNSECLENCPNGTIENEFNICVDKNTNVCSLSNFDLEVNIEEIETNNIELSASNYAKEFSYTNNHISQFNNELYSYILFKNSTCIDELTLNFSSIDFGSCYKNIQSYYNTTDELIISNMNLKSKQNKPVTLYEVFEPKNGKKIDIESICPNYTILINENILNYLFNKFSKNLLSEQKIDIFNLSGPFYTDICYHFESPVKKDIPLKDRITSFYPNISLCDNGCLYKGVNLETLKTECECKINDFIDNYLLFNNFPLTDLILNNAINLVKESNILVLKCYKDLFYSKYYKNNKGSFFSFGLITIQIICTIIFLSRDLFKIKKYIYNLTENYLEYIRLTNNILNFSETQQKYNNKKKKEKIN